MSKTLTASFVPESSWRSSACCPGSHVNHQNSSQQRLGHRRQGKGGEQSETLPVQGSGFTAPRTLPLKVLCQEQNKMKSHPIAGFLRCALLGRVPLGYTQTLYFSQIITKQLSVLHLTINTDPKAHSSWVSVSSSYRV